MEKSKVVKTPRYCAAAAMARVLWKNTIRHAAFLK